jgi:hypothetical protein
MTEATQTGREQRGDPNMVALLSLWLLLLAFFILLNSLAKLQDDRTRAVLASVDEAFNGRVEAPTSYVDFSAALGPLEQSERLFGDIGRLFESLVPVVETVTSADQSVMRLEFPANRLFARRSTDFKPGRRLLLRRLAEALTRDRNAGLTYRIDFLHGVPAGALDQISSAAPRALELQRMGALVREMIDLGLRPDGLSVGVTPARPGVVQFVVRVYEKEPPKVDFDDQAK